MISQKVRKRNRLSCFRKPARPEAKEYVSEPVSDHEAGAHQAPRGGVAVNHPSRMGASVPKGSAVLVNQCWSRGSRSSIPTTGHLFSAYELVYPISNDKGGQLNYSLGAFKELIGPSRASQRRFVSPPLGTKDAFRANKTKRIASLTTSAGGPMIFRKVP